jgi:hypothetical protein
VLNELERKFGRFAVPNVTLILIIGQVLMFVAAQSQPAILGNMVLIPSKVMDGEIHRLLTFMIMPPGDHLLWAFFFWYLFYLMGTALELFWGTFRYNVFLLIGYVATVATAFITPDQPVTNIFLKGTVFLAFAYLNPNFELRLMFILPVKIKWMAIFAWIMYFLGFVSGPLSVKLTIAASVLNFFVFFGKDVLYRMKSGQRQMAGQARRFSEKPPEYFHKCEVCGITDKTDPKMDFRYCSQCTSNYGYCTDHIRNHEHA